MPNDGLEYMGIYETVLTAQDPGQAYFSAQGNLSYNLGLPDCLNETAPGTNSSGCPSDCVDPTTIFTPTYNSLNNLYHCAMYTWITRDFRLGSLSETNNTYLAINHVDTSLSHAGAVTSTVSTCLAAYCESLSDCKARHVNPCAASELSINGSVIDSLQTNTCVQAICDSHPQPQANTDIAGIGMLAAYIIQVGLMILSALVLLGLWCAHMKVGQSLYQRQPQDHAYVGVAAESEDRPVLPTLNETRIPVTKRLEGALLVALVDFLKAQCFLAIAISIAALILVNSQRESLGEINQLALVTASGVCILPTTFNLYLLATFNPTRKSWFLYGLSLWTWVLGYSVALSPQMAALNRLNKVETPYLYDSSFPNACGNFSPLNLCGNFVPPNERPEYTFYYTLCLPVMVGLTVWQTTSISRVSTFFEATFPLKPRGYSWLIHGVLHVAALSFFAVPLYLFFQSISQLFQYGSVSTMWGFGQIVAVTVWIPTVAGFVNSYADGVDRAHTKQLPAGHSTVNTRMDPPGGRGSLSLQNRTTVVGP